MNTPSFPSQFWFSLRFTLVILVFAGVFYPLAVMGLGNMLFPQQAQGSLIKNAQSQVIGSSLIGQAFTRPEYFHPRPSANHYDAANSGGSNFGATSQKLYDRVKADVLTYRKENPTVEQIPVDAVTASASGLDPDISVENALIQAYRVAQARHLPVATAQQQIQQLASEGHVNVLRLNLAFNKQ